MYVLWFNFILGLNFIFFCFKLIIIHYHTQKQKKIKFKPTIKLNQNICIQKKEIFYICFQQTNIYPLPLKMEELASNTRSTFSAGGIHSADHMLAAVGCTGTSFY